MPILVGMGPASQEEVEIDKTLVEPEELEEKEDILVCGIRKHVIEVLDWICNELSGQEKLDTMKKFFQFLASIDDCKELLDKLVDIEREMEKAEYSEELGEEDTELQALNDILTV